MTATAHTTEQASEQLFSAVQQMLDAVQALARDPAVDFTMPAFGRLAKAHADLTDAQAAARA